MVGRLSFGRSFSRKTYTTVSGRKRKITSGGLFYSRGLGRMSKYSVRRDRKIKAKSSPHAKGYSKKNKRYAHTGDSNRRKRK
jgi:hypothetical protein